MPRLHCFLLAGLLALPAASARAADGFELRSGDRVVFLGGAVIEREQLTGYWETALTSAFPDRDVTFRNLGWSGDTVWGEARASFDTQREGYQRLLDRTRACKPTVIFLGYGTNESFAGAAGLPAFRAQLNKLLDDLAPTKARIVLLAPPQFEAARWRAGNLKQRQHDLQLYTDALRDIAGKRGARFAEEFCQQSHPAGPLTDDGMHLTSNGYRQTATALLTALHAPEHRLKEDQAEKLRRTIVEKNRLYFERWRPENETYLFGFRKHEQGQNAKEIPQFDPLIAQKEAAIAKLRKPIPHSYQLVPAGEEKQ